MEVYPVSCFSDNYAYVIVNNNTKQAICVDAAEPHNVLRKIDSLKVKLVAVLTTHRHYDHSGKHFTSCQARLSQGGNVQLNKLTGGSLPFYGSAYEETPGVTHFVKDGDHITFAEGLEATIFHAPCHTRGHVLYYFNQNNSSPLIFTGDTAFVAGCGRFFEGTAEEMVKNMERIKSLPSDTLMYPGHEYTLKNLEFALSIEPENVAAKEKYAWAKAQRAHHKPTVPSRIGEEKMYNPFMRFDDSELMKALETKTAEATMQKCRFLKDQF